MSCKNVSQALAAKVDSFTARDEVGGCGARREHRTSLLKAINCRGSRGKRPDNITNAIYHPHPRFYEPLLRLTPAVARVHAVIKEVLNGSRHPVS